MTDHIDFFNADIEPFTPATIERPLLSVKYPLDPTFERFLETFGAMTCDPRVITGPGVGQIIIRAFETKLMDAGYGKHASRLICSAARKAMLRGAQNASAHN